MAQILLAPVSVEGHGNLLPWIGPYLLDHIGAVCFDEPIVDSIRQVDGGLAFQRSCLKLNSIRPSYGVAVGARIPFSMEHMLSTHVSSQFAFADILEAQLAKLYLLLFFAGTCNPIPC